MSRPEVRLSAGHVQGRSEPKAFTAVAAETAKAEASLNPKGKAYRSSQQNRGSGVSQPRSEIRLRPNAPRRARKSGAEGIGQRGAQDTHSWSRECPSKGAGIERTWRFYSGPFFGSGFAPPDARKFISSPTWATPLLRTEPHSLRLVFICTSGLSERETTRRSN